MPPDGAKREHRRHHDADEDDRGLFHHQHPASATRYRSPSRPQREDDVPGDVRTWGVVAAVSGILQSLVWAGMSVAAALLYRDIIPWDLLTTAASWDDLGTLLTNLYFRETGVYLVAERGLTSSRVVYRFMAAVLVLAVFWLVTSSVMLRQMRLGGHRSVRGTAVAWSVSVVAVTIVDVMLAAAMVRDLVTLSDWPEAEAFPEAFHLSTLKLCPGIVLIVALRGGVLLVANVVCMLVILYRLAKGPLASDGDGLSTSSDSPSATKRSGPIDAFLYQNGDRNLHSLGVQNPVFVPDEVTDSATPAASVVKPWASFKPQEQQQQQQRVSAPGYHQGPGARNDRHTRTPKHKSQDDLDDVSHLSWMEEVDKHVDVRVRSVARPSAPAHHRFGLVEPAVNVHREAVAAATPPPRYHSSAPSPGHDSMLPRVRINPDAPKFPYIPPPDYSPPARRATVGRGPRRKPKPCAVQPIPVSAPEPPTARPGTSRASSMDADEFVAFEGYQSGEEDA